LAADGGFRWSYTVKGRIIGAPAVDPAGRIYVATSERRIYALTSEGGLHLLQHVPVDIRTAPVWDPRGFALFAGADEHLWAVSARAGILWRVRLPAPYAAGLERLASGRYVVGTEKGLFEVAFGKEKRFDAVGEAPVRFLGLGHDSLVVGTAQATQWLGLDGTERQKVGEVRFAALGRQTLATVSSSGEFEWWAASSDGPAAQGRVNLPGRVSAAPVLGSDGTAFIPTVDGRLLFVTNAGAAMAEGRVGRTSLHEPVLDEARRRVVVTTAGGRVAAFAWPGQSRGAGAE
jgi:outer membrane protein assembly factor BamB